MVIVHVGGSQGIKLSNDLEGGFNIIFVFLSSTHKLQASRLDPRPPFPCRYTSSKTIDALLPVAKDFDALKNAHSRKY
jgi:hypothetical protein